MVHTFPDGAQVILPDTPESVTTSNCIVPSAQYLWTSGSSSNPTELAFKAAKQLLAKGRLKFHDAADFIALIEELKEVL